MQILNFQLLIGNNVCQFHSTRDTVPEEFATSWGEELRTETEGRAARSPTEQELEELEETELEGSLLGSETKQADE